MSETLAFPKAPRRAWPCDGREAKTLLLQATPIALVALVNMAMSVTDTVMAAGHGTGALAAVAVGSDFYSIVFYLVAGTIGGLAPLCASASEAGDEDRLKVLRSAGWAVVAVIGALAVPVIWHAPSYLRHLGLDPELLARGAGYTRAMALTLIPMAVTATLRCRLTAIERPGLLLKVTLMAVPLNALGNQILMNGVGGWAGYGITGAGLSSLLVSSFTALALLALGRRASDFGAAPRIDARAVAEVLRIGFPIGLATLAEVGIFLSATLYAATLAAEEAAAHAIAIRTAVVHQGRMAFSVGGGIVYDSDPADEYEETLHKGRTLVNVCRECPPLATAPEKVWLDGRICPATDACLSIADEGLRYGYGFFETIRAQAGKIPLLDRHQARWEKSWRTLWKNEPPDITWATVIRQVLAANQLTAATAAVRLTATKSQAAALPDYHLFVTAHPYRHRLDVLDTAGLRLYAYPEPRQTPLADHKTLNYLFYRQAGLWAQAQGADEAIIVNPDGTISETNTANLLVVRGGTVLRPRSAHVLPGVMEACVLKQLAAMGYGLRHRPIYPGELFEADQVLLTNALMGCVPAIALDGRNLAAPDDLAQKINAFVFDPQQAGNV